MSHIDPEIQQLKQRIAEVYARRESLKRELESGTVAPRTGFAQLEITDQELSGLDSRFKKLWDASQSIAGATHPAAKWAQGSVFEPMHLDCVTAIMLKILDAKCKMGSAEKNALIAVYDVVKQRPGQTLDAEIHLLITAARAGIDAELAARVHAWREFAEEQISKPVMKNFKQWLRSSLPMN